MLPSISVLFSEDGRFDLTVEIFPDNYFSEIVFVKFFRKYPLTMKERQKKPVEPLECDTSGVPK